MSQICSKQTINIQNRGTPESIDPECIMGYNIKEHIDIKEHFSKAKQHNWQSISDRKQMFVLLELCAAGHN